MIGYGSTNDNHFEKIVGFPKRQRYHGSPTYPNRLQALQMQNVRNGGDRSGPMGMGGGGLGWCGVGTGGD